MKMLSAAALVSLTIFAMPAKAGVLELTKEVAGLKVDYKLVLPIGYDSEKTYPAIIAFGGGAQTMEGVERLLADISSWRWPRPKAKFFFAAAHRYFPNSWR
jgi:poly(3-hydroxybutyrate) depolymerase